MARRRRYVRRTERAAEKQPSTTAPARWVQERTAVLRALEGYPEARQAVLRELDAVAAEEAPR